MKKILLAVAVIFVAYHMASLSAVYGQNKKDEITAEEKSAANELADRFIRRLDETGNIEPLIKEMFVNDFMQRYVSEGKHQMAVEPDTKRILFSSGFEYDPVLLDKATDDDWRKFYITSFNFLQYEIVISLNEMSKYGRPMTRVEQDKFETFVETIYPE